MIPRRFDRAEATDHLIANQVIASSCAFAEDVGVARHRKRT
jgi:hypothetical protein